MWKYDKTDISKELISSLGCKIEPRGRRNKQKSVRREKLSLGVLKKRDLGNGEISEDRCFSLLFNIIIIYYWLSCLSLYLSKWILVFLHFLYNFKDSLLCCFKIVLNISKGTNQKVSLRHFCIVLQQIEWKTLGNQHWDEDLYIN